MAALGILPQGPELAGPGLVYGQSPARRILLDKLLFLLVPETREDAGERLGSAAGLELGDTGQGSDHDPTGLGLPPGVYDRTLAPAEVLVIPHPRLRVYRLTYGSK